MDFYFLYFSEHCPKFFLHSQNLLRIVHYCLMALFFEFLKSLPHPCHFALQNSREYWFLNFTKHFRSEKSLDFNLLLPLMTELETFSEDFLDALSSVLRWEHLLVFLIQFFQFIQIYVLLKYCLIPQVPSFQPVFSFQ